MKITSRADAFVAKPDPRVRAILIYGPDAGLVRERLNGLTRSAVGSLDDPFRIAEFSADSLREDPAKLGDEAAALSFGGGRRVVRVRDASDTVADVIAAFAEEPVGDALVLVSADDLGPRSKLRAAFEKAELAAALPCYADTSQSLEVLIKQNLAAAGLGIAPEALSWLEDRLGSDRELTRRELEKLVLYMGDGGGAKRSVSEDDVLACIGDTAALGLDDLIFAVGDGDQASVQRVFGRLMSEGESPVSALTAVARHFMRLHETKGRVADGKSFEQAAAMLRPPVFFKVKTRFQAQVGRWSLDLLARALSLLTEAETQAKSTDIPTEAVVERALIQLANVSRRTG